MTPALRLGTVPYLNALPLLEGLGAERGVRLVEAPPAGLARRLRAGELDAALVSALELFADPAPGWVPGPAITSRGAVWSILLYLNTPLQELRSVALDATSLSAAALARICLSDFLGLRGLRFGPCDPALPLDGVQADAVLRIGDPALLTDPGGRRTLDLGQIWARHTGLPFVYALWVTRPGLPAEPLTSVLHAARARGLVRRDALAAAFADCHGLDPRHCQEYLCERIGYDLGPAEREGLSRFGTLCARHGLVARASLPAPLAHAARHA